jgi:phosphomethylpyrimidine synthase
MVEGPGHMPLDQIEMNMRVMKRICHDAPFYVLGPLTTDSAPGYDHIVGAIGGAVAAINGADFLCYVTPAEHLCLPTLNDVRDGVMASKIAAHSADVVRNVGAARERDYNMSEARRNLDWEQMYTYALDPEIARRRKSESESGNEDYCTMCGNLCAVKNDRNL